mmetsp:Transcript_34104/g.52386  ORF Transcript_34104/g.52386 Transcript_34104/m.52386 type:complete len:99 (-) Transcript_34104:1422-1718(-)
MIFFEQRKFLSGVEHNKDLTEITDPNSVSLIQQYLNFGVMDKGETAPVIVGTVVNDRKRGFSRKLRMMRGDLFSMLSVCQSCNIVSNNDQIRDIKRGV